MRRGDVHWFRFEAPDKRRPVASLTTTVRDAPSQVLLGPEVGLPKPCAANLQQVFTVERERLGPLITTLPASILDRVDVALIFALGVGEQNDLDLAH